MSKIVTIKADIPAHLKNRVTKLAKINKRTISATVVLALEDYVDRCLGVTVTPDICKCGHKDLDHNCGESEFDPPTDCIVCGCQGFVIDRLISKGSR